EQESPRTQSFWLTGADMQSTLPKTGGGGRFGSGPWLRRSALVHMRAVGVRGVGDLVRLSAEAMPTSGPSCVDGVSDGSSLASLPRVSTVQRELSTTATAREMRAGT